MNNFNYSIYLVTDESMLKNKSLTEAIEEAISGGVTLVQLRKKDASSRSFYETALAVKKVTDKYNVPLIINDRIDIAIAVDASGVHLGQSDMPLAIARHILGNQKIIGISAADLTQAKDAVEGGADYLGVGAVFPTQTKSDAKVNTIENLKLIKKTYPQMPMVGIGGINKTNITQVKETGCEGVAVVSAILAQDDIKKAAEELKNIWNK